MTVYGAIVLIVFIVLCCQRWFWMLVFGLSALASSFTVLASIIHFQILNAVGFSVLTVILFTILGAISK